MSGIGLSDRMKAYEEVYEKTLPNDGYIVIRLDGRAFTRLTIHDLGCEKPYDIRFKEFMIGTAEAVLDCGIQPVYAYQQSDEISIFLSRNDSFYNRRLLKLASVLASVARSAFSLASGVPASFDARVMVLPKIGEVVSYFDWRLCDCVRNCLNAYCYWTLRHADVAYDETTQRLKNKNTAYKVAMLKDEFGIDFETVPSWQKTGIGFRYEVMERVGVNRVTGEETRVERLTRVIDESLPQGAVYRKNLNALFEARS